MHLGVPMKSQAAPTTIRGAQTTSQGALTSNQGAPVASPGAPQITFNQSGQNNIFLRNAAGAPGNHSHYFSCNDI
jgi:hypothetical protein